MIKTSTVKGDITDKSESRDPCSSPEVKKRKTSADEEVPAHTWMDEVRNDRMLTNVSISMAQDLIHGQFPSINGLLPTMEQYQIQPTDSGNNQLQIFHCQQRKHWIAASSIGCLDSSVNIYDSVFNSLDSRTIDVIKNHFPSRTICVQSFQKQSGGKDCGLFSIAAITTIAYGQDPSDISFIQTEMRKHLIKCFANKIITPFPCQ